jgi:hypothetical protein
MGNAMWEDAKGGDVQSCPVSGTSCLYWTIGNPQKTGLNKKMNF